MIAEYRNHTIPLFHTWVDVTKRTDSDVFHCNLKNTAKLIRYALKEAFASKFSVRIEYLTHGSTAIDVNWVDGPKYSEVAAVVEKFKSLDFNLHNDDSTTSRESIQIGGVKLTTSCDFLTLFRRDEHGDLYLRGRE